MLPVKTSVISRVSTVALVLVVGFALSMVLPPGTLTVALAAFVGYKLITSNKSKN